MVQRKRILSGMRPTGRLHLGNLHGALDNWIQLQSQYECFFFVADWHALTTDYATPGQIREHTWNMILDWLSVGLNPDQSTLFIQSQVKEHAALYVLLGTTGSEHPPSDFPVTGQEVPRPTCSSNKAVEHLSQKPIADSPS